MSGDARATPVPQGRLPRLLRMGGLTSGVLGSAVAAGIGQVARGQRASLAGAFLTPSVAARLARDLGQMRGAAMKLGQMLSMDPGLVLPPEMTALLSALRADAPPMPPKQLQTVLDAEWGAGWYGRFARFDVRPFAAASIGQVHRAVTKDGRALAVKVQYPGVRASIDSDLANIETIFRLPGLLPRGMDLAPMLAEARRQLHQEADYQTEVQNLTAFRTLLAGDGRYLLPEVAAEISTPQVLAMTYLDSQPIDALVAAPQEARDRVAAALIDLCLHELFTFGRMQTDPNLANYRYCPASGRVVLLDFGAVMPIGPGMRDDFRALLRAALGDDPGATRAALLGIGYFDAKTAPEHQDLIQRMFVTAMGPLRQAAPFDFGTSPLLETLRDMGMAMAMDRDLSHVPPPATMFLHRKIGGIYLLATKLRARIALRPMVERFC